MHFYLSALKSERHNWRHKISYQISFTLNPFEYDYVETDENTVRKLGLVVTDELNTKNEVEFRTRFKDIISEMTNDFQQHHIP